MSGNNGNGGGNPATPMDRAIAWLANALAFAIAFVAAPQISGATREWAVGYMVENYGAWLAGIGGFFWFLIVAALTFFATKVATMTFIKYAQIFGAVFPRR
ncbi:MAG: hypothetical protein WDN24_02280 [Sphingomonas sp.]